MICVGSAASTFFKSSRPALSLAPASVKLFSNLDFAVLHHSSFENSWNTTVRVSLHSDLSLVADGLTAVGEHIHQNPHRCAPLAQRAWRKGGRQERRS